MRIALVTDLYSPQVSGVADSVATLAASLRRLGHKVRVYAPGDTVPGEIDVCRLPAWDVPGTAGGMSVVWSLGVFRDMAAFAPDIIHTHSFSTLGMAGLFAGWLLRVPMIGTDHTFPADYLHYLNIDNDFWRKAARLFAAWYYGHCRIVTAPSDSMLRELDRHGLHRPQRVVSNPIAGALFRPLSNRPALQTHHGIPPNAVLLFGRVAVEKNLEVAVAAFDRLCHLSTHTANQPHLVIVGDGPAADALRADIAQRGLSDRLIWKGMQHGGGLAEIINACAVSLITSQSETQSMTTLQSMACGVPVVAVRAGGLPEYVRHEETGLLAEARNPTAIAAALHRVLSDPALANSLGRAGQAHVAQYAPETIAETFVTLYRSCRRVKTPLSTLLADIARGQD